MDNDLKTPPPTGDRLSLRRPEQSAPAATLMWLGFGLRTGVLHAFAVIALALLLYASAFVILYVFFSA